MRMALIRPICLGASAALLTTWSLTAEAQRNGGDSQRHYQQYEYMDETIVQLFEWTWNDVATECEGFLSAKGYSAVQVSPPQEHVYRESRPWWERYQPVSYKLDSRGGSEAEFRSMVQRCRDAGIKIYVDVVLNHMTGLDATLFGNTYYGTSGSSYQRFSYPGIYSHQDFNHCGRNGENSPIENWQDRWEIQHCNLVRLSDLKTSSGHVRRQLAGYLNKLLDIGVEGFRVDAAKHMPAEDLTAVTSRLNRPAYVYQEVIDHGNEPISGSEYFHIGRVTEFRYGKHIGSVLRNGKMTWLKEFGSSWGMVEDHHALVFVDNHDTQRGHDDEVLSFRDNERYVLANIFMLAWPYGSPRVMSSYGFDSFGEGPPKHENGEVMRVHKEGGGDRCYDKWKCEHRWRSIANMVLFRKNVGRAPVTNWWSNGNNLIAFGRGDKGFVVLNKEDTRRHRTFQTSLEPGRYCDVISGDYIYEENRCTGDVIVVNGKRQFSATLLRHSALAMHRGAKLL